MVKPLPLKLDDEKAERVRRSTHDAITEIQGLPAVSLKVIRGVTLADGVVTQVAHGLGREPLWFSCSPPRNASATGRIMDYRSGTIDRSKFLGIQASGYGATITVDVAVL